MKLFCIFILCTALSVNFIFGQMPTSGLIAHYNFNRDANKDTSRLYDISGNRNHGTILGSIHYTPDRFGVGCSALFFDGQTFISVPTSKSLERPQDAITIAVWFKIANHADFFKQWITICCKSDQTDETSESPQYRMQATAQTVSINTEFTENVIPQLKYEVWYFYAYTYDGSTVKVFLNGRYVFEYNYSGKLNRNNMPLEIGRDLPGTLEYYFGAMDDLRIYDRALSEKELNQLYQDNSEAGDLDRCPNLNTYLTTRATPHKTTTSAQPTIKVKSSGLPSTNTDEEQDSLLPSSVTPTASSTTVSPSSPSIPGNQFLGLPDTLDNIPINYQEIINVKNINIFIYPYDNEKEDGDIVSININGVWVRDYYELKTKKDNPSRGALIKCSLNPGNYNYFISRAWNLGKIPPNTLTIEINDGVSVQKVTINSEIGLSGGIRINCEK